MKEAELIVARSVFLQVYAISHSASHGDQKSSPALLQKCGIQHDARFYTLTLSRLKEGEYDDAGDRDNSFLLRQEAGL